MEGETWRNPDGGLTMAFATEIGFYASRWRHYSRSYSLKLTCISVSAEGSKGVAGEGLAVGPQIGAQRHYRPPHWFIHKYQRIAISQRCHHFTVEAKPPHTHTPHYSSKRYDKPDTLISLPPLSLLPSPADRQYGCAGTGYIQFTRQRLSNTNMRRQRTSLNQQQADRKKKRKRK